MNGPLHTRKSGVLRSTASVAATAQFQDIVTVATHWKYPFLTVSISNVLTDQT